MFNNLDDPKTQLLIALAGGLLSGSPHGRKNFGQDLGHAGLLGLGAYNNARVYQTRAQEEEQQREMRKMQMEQMRDAQNSRTAVQGAFRQAFAQPNVNLVQGDDEGNAMPQAPGGGGMQEFLRIAGPHMDPLQAASLMQKQGPMKLGKDERLVDPSSLREILGPAPERPKMPETGKLREVYKGGTVIQQEWDGAKWNDVGSGPRFKPNEPDKPPPPQLYNGPDGPVWVTPPARGQTASLPVAGPDGQPIKAPPKPEKPLTEAEAKATLYVGMMQDAEASISKLNFDPTKITNQTDIALARGDLPKIPKALQNASASKEAQQYAQGTFQWTEAMLRQLTGAAAPEAEVWRQVKTYWPQPFDKAEHVKQKNEARARVQQMVRIVAGAGAAKVDNTPRPGKEDPLGIR